MLDCGGSRDGCKGQCRGDLYQEMALASGLLVESRAQAADGREHVWMQGRKSLLPTRRRKVASVPRAPWARRRELEDTTGGQGHRCPVRWDTAGSPMYPSTATAALLRSAPLRAPPPRRGRGRGRGLLRSAWSPPWRSSWAPCAPPRRCTQELSTVSSHKYSPKESRWHSGGPGPRPC